MSIPEYSPRMLALFIAARVTHAVECAGGDTLSEPAKDAAERTARASLRKAAGVTVADFDLAAAGKRASDAARTRLWASFDQFPNLRKDAA